MVKIAFKEKNVKAPLIRYLIAISLNHVILMVPNALQYKEPALIIG
jgi:hypothetical protein